MSFSTSSNVPDYGATNSRFGSRNTSRPQLNSNFDIATYHQLGDNISCNIFSINNNVTALEKASKEIGTITDSPSLRGKIQSTQQNTKNLVSNTTKLFKELTSVVNKGGREHRLQFERVRNEFQATVQRYDTLQKQLGPKMKQTVLQEHASRQNVWGFEEEEEQQSLLDADNIQQQKRMEEELEFERDLLLEREERIREIETNMLDVNQVFKDLAAMVHEQGDTIGSIEQNITAAAYNVEEGQQQLSKASSYQRAYRTKLCCLVVILVIVAAVIALVIYLSVN